MHLDKDNEVLVQKYFSKITKKNCHVLYFKYLIIEEIFC